MRDRIDYQGPGAAYSPPYETTARAVFWRAVRGAFAVGLAFGVGAGLAAYAWLKIGGLV